MKDSLEVLLLTSKAVINNTDLKRIVLFLEIHSLSFFTVRLGEQTLVKLTY